MAIISKEKRRRENTRELLEAQAELLLAARESEGCLASIIEAERTASNLDWVVVDAVQRRLKVAAFAVDHAIRTIKEDNMVRR
jgi:hypothetical protein